MKPALKSHSQGTSDCGKALRDRDFLRISLGRIDNVKISLKWHNSQMIDEIKVGSIICKLDFFFF